jgi:phosphoglycolate phosphatase
MAVLSNKPQPLHPGVFIAHYFPGVRFVDVRGAGPDTPLKPDPAGGSRSPGPWALPPGADHARDTRIDVATGVNAGLHAVGVLWGFREAR